MTLRQCEASAETIPAVPIHRGLTALLLLCMMALIPAAADNRVRNPGFENKMKAWQWSKKKASPASGTITTRNTHSGEYAFRIANGPEDQPRVWGGVFQIVRGLKPKTAYHLSFWCKGDEVGRCNLKGWGIGKWQNRWRFRERIPYGSYDWRLITTQFTTEADQTAFKLIFIAENMETKGLWLDDVSITPADAEPQPVIYPPSTISGLPPKAGFYPALSSGDDRTAPTLSLRSSEDKAFGGEIRAKWTTTHLQLHVDVVDPTRGEVIAGRKMYENDSIQIMIDTTPKVYKPSGYTDSCYELGFAVLPSGDVARASWHCEIDLKAVDATGRRTERGYRLDVAIPWRQLDLKDRPDTIGFNFQFIDGDGSDGRRRLQWMPTFMGNTKLPNKAGTIICVTPDMASAACLKLSGRPDGTYRRDDRIAGKYVQYGFQALSESEVQFAAHDNEGQTAAEFGSVTMPRTPKQHLRQVSFMFPARQLDEGKFRIVATPPPLQYPLTAPLQRVNVQRQIQRRTAKQRDRLKQLRQSASDMDVDTRDSYVRLGLVLACMYLDRIENRWNQKPDWTLMQLQEIGDVLNKTENQLQLLQSGRRDITSLPAPHGPVSKDRGLLWTEDNNGKVQPLFIGGYGHFDTVAADIELFPKIGVAMATQEASGRHLHKEKMAPRITELGNIFDRAADAGVFMDIHVGPHVYPKWLLREHPGIREGTGGHFFPFNIDHPAARKAGKQWLQKLLGRLNDRPAFLSTTLAVEPGYQQSGRGPHSKDEWVQYLKETHGSIGALNQLYGTDYNAFSEVAVPQPQMPKKLQQKRAYYDWVRFNCQHFAAWHRWANDLVHKHAPDVFTHARIHPFMHWSRRGLARGIDPELICRITDLAGNHASAYPVRVGRYGFQWCEGLEMWYDLLHSFRGQPVYDTADHLIRDSSKPDYISPKATYAELWQSYLHHVAGDLMWEWHDARDWINTNWRWPGIIYRRPANIHAASRAMFDARRLRNELAAVNLVQPRVALLYSPTSLFWQADYRQVAADLYRSLTFLGTPITYISERQLIGDTRSRANENADWLILPHTTHLRESTVRALVQFQANGGHIITVGRDCCHHDRYSRPRSLPSALQNANHIALPADTTDHRLQQKLWSILRDGGITFTRLNDTDGGRAWGVEYRTIEYNGATLVPMVNFLNESITVNLEMKPEATDLLNYEEISLHDISFAPLQCRFLRIE